jgi:MraZ protein
MQSRKTPYGWMALGGLLCLLGFGLACKMRDGSQARAQVETPPATGDAQIPVVPLPEAGDDKPTTKPKEERLAPTTDALPSNDDALPLPGINNKQPKETPPTMPSLTIATPPPTDTTPLPLPPPSGGVVPVGFQDKPMSPPPPDAKGSAEPARPQVVGDLPGSPPLPLSSTPPPIPDLPTPPSATSSTPQKALEGKHEAEKNAVTPAVNVSVPALGMGGTPVVITVTPVRGETRSEPGEPPLAPSPGPVQMYQVRLAQETLMDIARRTLGDANRWDEIYKLNPSLKPEVALVSGAFVRLPADACVPPDEVSDVKPLPLLGADSGPVKPKHLMPLTGTYPCNLDDKRLIALPRAMRDQLGEGDTVLVSPGPDHCLWVTNQDHLERLAKRLETSQAREHEVRSFRRLYFAQTEKVSLSAEGRIVIPERLAQFAGLHQEVVLIGIDDHFELWDVARWRQYTQTRSAAARSAMSED